MDLAAIDAQIAAAAAGSDLTAEADARARRAAALTMLNRLPEAMAELEQSATLFFQANNPLLQAKTLYGLGILQARQPASVDAARHTLGRARALATMAGNEDLATQCAFRQVGIEVNAGAHDKALGILDHLRSRLEQVGRSASIIEIWRMRANIHQLQGRINQALTDMEAGQALAESLGDEMAALQFRLERRVLQPFSADPGMVEDFSMILADAHLLGASGMVGAIELQRAADALRRKDAVTGIRAAEAARAEALRANDPILYTVACLLIAEGREAEQDRAGVIGILLTCKSTLEQHLGKEMGKQVVMVLQALERRWGKAAMDQALAEHRARMAKRTAEA